MSSDAAPQPSDRPLRDRRLLVIGAGTRELPLPDLPVGNGRAIAVLAARQGAAVACADLDEGAARITADWISGEGGHATVLVGDVADAARVATLVTDAEASLGGLDAVVVNPGIGYGLGIAGTSDHDWDAVMAVNLRAPFLAIKAALEVLPEGGSIVVTGSVAGQRPGSGIPSYDTSKAAIDALVRTAALEAAPKGIRINVVAPGFIDTPIGRLASIVNEGRDAAPVPLGRHGTAWEVAEVVTFLLSDRASYVTGQTVTVDGGLLLA